MESGDSTYTMYDYTKRTLGAVGDKIEKLPQKTLKFSFDLEDLTPVYIAETLRLNNYTILLIKEEAEAPQTSTSMVVLYKKFRWPVSAFILTIIAVSVSSMKRREEWE
jgi:lipopolysaccharide export system permease protein